jgi:hypothetical protein
MFYATNGSLSLNKIVLMVPLIATKYALLRNGFDLRSDVDFHETCSPVIKPTAFSFVCEI